MRIALHVDCPPGKPTGIARYMYELGSALVSKGDHVEGWARWRWLKSARNLFSSSSIEIKPLLSTKQLQDPFLPSIYARTNGIEIIHSPNGQILTGRHGIRQSVMVHDLAIFIFPDIKPEAETMKWKEKISKAVREADGILVNSATTASDLQQFFPESTEKIFLTRLGIDHFYRANKTPAAHGEHILAVGTVEPRKNYQMLFKAYAEALSINNYLPPLIIAGGMGYRSDEICEAAEKSPAGDRVKFTGYISDSRLKELYSKACCLVHPAIYEGFGFTVPEALGFGLPVVCSKNSSLEELFTGSVYFVNAHDHGSIAAGLILAVEEGMTNSQKKCSEELFQSLKWEDCAEASEAAFEKIIS